MSTRGGGRGASGQRRGQTGGEDPSRAAEAARGGQAGRAAEERGGEREQRTVHERAHGRPASSAGPPSDTGGRAASPAPSEVALLSPSAQGLLAPPVQAMESQWDLDVTVLAFAQWVSEMKSRQQNSQHQMQAEMSIIRNAITSNNGDLTDFKRHSAAIQSQMQSEINEIRETLSSVFMEITAAVRNNAAADQDIKLKIQSLNEQAVRNETAFAQLADAADQSQTKLRNAVQEMQLSSERMRDEIGNLSRQSETLETSVGERTDRLGQDLEHLATDLRQQLDQRKEHLKKMVSDVMQIGESLHGLLGDFGTQKKSVGDSQGKLQRDLDMLSPQPQRPAREDSGPARRAAVTGAPHAGSVSPQAQGLQQQSPVHVAQRPITPIHQRPPATSWQPGQPSPPYQLPGSSSMMAPGMAGLAPAGYMMPAGYHA